MFIADADKKKIFAPLGANPESIPAAKVLNISRSYKHFAPTAREREEHISVAINMSHLRREGAKNMSS